MTTLAHDLHYGIRTLLRSPRFTLTGVLVLTMAIGGNTAVFSIINGVLLRPLPYPHADRLVVLDETNLQKGLNHFKFTPADFVLIRDQGRVFDAVAAYNFGTVTLTGDGQPERLGAAEVSADFFRVLESGPAAGRGFLPTDDRPGPASQVAILSHSLWQRHFGGALGLLGNTIVLDQTVYTVVGILPASFDFAGTGNKPAEIWMPAAYDQKYLASHGHEIAVVARLKPRMTLREAQAEMDTLARQLAQQDPSTSGGWTMGVASLQDSLVSQVRPYLLLLFAAIAFVLLIAVVNMASLLVARALLRQRDIALRLSLGATRSQIVRHFLTESLLLSCVGGALGVSASYFGVSAFLHFTKYNPLYGRSVGLDWRVLAFSLALSLGTGILFGLAPAIFVLNADLMNVLREGTSSISRNVRRWQQVMLLGEIAFTLLLLIAAGLSISSFSHILSVDSGFDSSHVLTMRMSLPSDRYRTTLQRDVFAERLLGSVRALPGVREAGLSHTFPLRHDMTVSFVNEEGRVTDRQSAPNANFYSVSPGYFEAMGISMLRGRHFTPADRQDSPRVAIVSESLARQFFPGTNPLGKRLREESGDPEKDWMTIVGVVRDVKQVGLTSPVKPQLYEPYLQHPYLFFTLAVKTDNAPLEFAGPVQRRIAEIDSEQPAYDVFTMEDIVAASLSNWRLSASLLSVFAVMSLVLAATGLYGVLAFTMGQRSREFGIRAALGATQDRLLKAVLGEILLLAGAGAVVAAILAIGMLHALSSVLYGLSSTDLWIFPASVLLLSAVAVLAGYLPALRATRIDLVAVLRCD